MPYTRTFESFAPPRRYDSLPFISAQIRESATEAGTYSTIETITLSPVDSNPAAPITRNFTTNDAILPDGWYIIRWVDAAASTFDSDPVNFSSGGTAYLMTGELRSYLGVSAAVLSAAAADRLIEDASDLIDAALGSRQIDPLTGRKVIQDEVKAWQWAKLKRATLKVAAKLYADPALATPQQFETVKGPDFETTGPRGGVGRFGSDVTALLSDSYLPVHSGRAV